MIWFAFTSFPWSGWVFALLKDVIVSFSMSRISWACIKHLRKPFKMLARMRILLLWDKFFVTKQTASRCISSMCLALSLERKNYFDGRRSQSSTHFWKKKKQRVPCRWEHFWFSLFSVSVDTLSCFERLSRIHLLRIRIESWWRQLGNAWSRWRNGLMRRSAKNSTLSEWASC